MRSGRSARLGARVGRIVRVVRLVRILKLYKAVYEAQRKRAQKKRGGGPGEDDDWGDEEDDTGKPKPKATVAESRVGKKLSELTIRRVIFFVLIMLLVLPFLQTNTVVETPYSGFYGADEIARSYKDWQSTKAANPAPRSQTVENRLVRLRAIYMDSVMKFVYYHNWFNKKYEYGAAVFMLTVWSRNSISESQVADMQLTPEAIETWNDRAQRGEIDFGKLPREVNELLARPWTSPCSSQSRGISILTKKISESSDFKENDYVVECPSDLRAAEVRTFFPIMEEDPVSEDLRFQFNFDARRYTRADALFSIYLTCFICFVLVVASLSFASDANKLVLKPLESMINRVREIRKDPLVAMKMADEEFKTEEKERTRRAAAKMQWKNQIWRCFMLGSASTSEPMETVVLEKTIIKLGSLLALGFGVAGANIIGQNMGNSDSAGVNVMIPGTKVDCILGRVRIRDFTTATEVLQAKVMTFVNQIAEIVHGVVDEYQGAANKNNGDTFLLIWRLSDYHEDVDQRTMTQEQAAKMADMSLVCVASIFGSIHRSPLLATYRGHPGLQQRLGSKTRVNVAFGLHAGWAIEGAVGTEFKIDASYLSPNVSIAETLNDATQIYGVNTIISDAVIGLCSPKVSSRCRLIDNIRTKGSVRPIQLYTLDLDPSNLTVESGGKPIHVWNSRQRFKVRQFLHQHKLKKLEPEYHVWHPFEHNEDLLVMRKPFTVEFLQQFNMGYQNYSEGEWEVARRLLTGTRSMLQPGLRTEDGPSVALLRFMEEPHRFKAPEGWQGVHVLSRDRDSSFD